MKLGVLIRTLEFAAEKHFKMSQYEAELGFIEKRVLMSSNTEAY